MQKESCGLQNILFTRKEEFPGWIMRMQQQSALATEAVLINPLAPNDHYSGHTTPLTYKRCISYIYSTNIGTEYFKHGIYSYTLHFFLFKMQFIS